MALLEFEITASQVVDVNIGAGILANMELYNGATGPSGIPGPTINATVGDDIVVRLINDLPYPTGIHWHGIELQNSADGTPVTQDAALVGPFTPPPSPLSPTGGTYLYKFKVTRPGIFWYHPHHFHSTNRVFRGLFGMIIVKDDQGHEDALVMGNVIPAPSPDYQLLLSDITVCKTVNDTETYVDPTTLPVADRAEWLSGSTSQPGPHPDDLCVISPVQEDGTPGPAFGNKDVPNIQTPGGRVNEGQTILTNGVNVGGRLGAPTTLANPMAAPGAFVGATVFRTATPGSNVRFQVANVATSRYFRLRLTDTNGNQIRLVRIGGEGGLLNDAIEEGGTIGTFDTKYDEGEILLPPATRADFVATMPISAADGPLTMWTRDYENRGGMNTWAETPTVPVLHINLTGTPVVPAPINDGTGLLSTLVGASTTFLASTPVSWLDSGAFVPSKPGIDFATATDPNIIKLEGGGSPKIDGHSGHFHGFTPYTNSPHIVSSRYLLNGSTLEFTVENKTSTHHPFHLHGFSFQPISLTRPSNPTRTWTQPEYMDVVDIPGNYTLTARVHLEDRPLADGVTMAGAYGRWLYHCHIFYHAHRGMLSELVVTDANGKEKPNIDVRGSWAYAPINGVATRTGTYAHPDAPAVTVTTLTASIGTVTDLGSGQWSWELDNSVLGLPAQTTYVYITATDSLGKQDQTVFRLKLGAPDDGSDLGDPHIRTVNGVNYDFQAVGEFTLLKDRSGLEIQTRQTPVLSANPLSNGYTGLKVCVSVNTAVAARVGSHYISYQPRNKEGDLDFFLDGKPFDLTRRGIFLDGNRVSFFDANGKQALRVDYGHRAVLTVTPWFWSSHNIHCLNVRVSHVGEGRGLMGEITSDSWLPVLPNGAKFGPKPASLSKRFDDLYRTFADGWRVTNATSMFTYNAGESTATFTDRDWPSEKPPCKMKPQFDTGAPEPTPIDVDDAKKVCALVTEGDLFENCVFDVAATGEKEFAEAYLVAQKIRLEGTSVQVVSDVRNPKPGDKICFTAIVSMFHLKSRIPKGTIAFFIDNKRVSEPIRVDEKGRAQFKIELKEGVHKVHAEFNVPETKEQNFSNSTSAIFFQTVGKRGEELVPNGKDEEEVKPTDQNDDQNSSDSKPVPNWVWIILGILFLALLAWLLLK